MECGSRAAAVETCDMVRSQKREQGSRTPQTLYRAVALLRGLYEDRGQESGSRWKSQHRTLREEIEWAKDEVVPHDGHDRPIFGAGDVVEAERVPGDDVGVFDGAIGFGPGGQSVVAFAFGGIDAGGEALVLLIRCDPELMG